jgi:hypothetical protein
MGKSTEDGQGQAEVAYLCCCPTCHLAQRAVRKEKNGKKTNNDIQNRKQNIEQQEQHEKSGVASCTPLLTPVVLLLSNIR